MKSCVLYLDFLQIMHNPVNHQYFNIKIFGLALKPKGNFLTPCFSESSSDTCSGKDVLGLLHGFKYAGVSLLSPVVKPTLIGEAYLNL